MQPPCQHNRFTAVPWLMGKRGSTVCEDRIALYVFNDTNEQYMKTAIREIIRHYYVEQNKSSVIIMTSQTSPSPTLRNRK